MSKEKVRNTGGNNLPLVAQDDPQVFCITGNAIDRQPQNGGNNGGGQYGNGYTNPYDLFYYFFGSRSW